MKGRSVKKSKKNKTKKNTKKDPKKKRRRSDGKLGSKDQKGIKDPKKKRRRSDGKKEPKRKKKVTFDPLGMMVSINRDNGDDVGNWNEWVAATSTRNYVLNDGILDVLKTKGSTLTKVNINYQNKFIKTIGNYNPKSFVSSLMHQGVKFERHVIKLIRNTTKSDNIINIGGDHNPRSRIKYLNTIEAMNNGIPIIYQGILRNYNNKTYGIPDLLVRSDYLDKLFTMSPLTKAHSKKRAKKLKNPKNPKFKNPSYHYVVIDIKFKTLHLKSDGIHLRNDGPMKAYKSQLCVYNEALGLTQGYEPPAAFIMGWKWKYVSKTIEYRGDNCFDRLGRIDYKKSDKHYVDITSEAIDWVINVRENAHTWDLSKVPLPHEQLYPNMCNRYDYPYHKIKKKFAEDIEEITLVWKCGPKQRKEAHSNGIYSWKDPRCTTEMLGIGGEYTKKIVNRILEANRSKTQNIFPQFITNNFGNWKNSGRLEFFVDFEMTCSVFTEFDDLPYSNGKSLIFMIGVGYMDYEGDWIFRDFTLDKLDEDGEFQICSEFVEYINDMMDKYKCFEPPALYHWSHAEPSSWRRTAERHLPQSFGWTDLNWVDLLKVFQTEPIGIKGCLNYGLKNVAKTFHKLGYISTIWDSGSSCADGADAAVGAYRVGRETERRGVSFKSDPLTQEIIKYNEVDCKVLQEIIFYLRTNHISPGDGDVDDGIGFGWVSENSEEHSSDGSDGRENSSEDGCDGRENSSEDGCDGRENSSDEPIPMDISSSDSFDGSDDSDTVEISESTERLEPSDGSDTVEILDSSDNFEKMETSDTSESTERLDMKKNKTSETSEDSDTVEILDGSDGSDGSDTSELSDGSEYSDDDSDIFDILDYFEDIDGFPDYIYLCPTCDSFWTSEQNHCDHCNTNLYRIDNYY